jgi:hypothetical protein
MHTIFFNGDAQAFKMSQVECIVAVVLGSNCIQMFGTTVEINRARKVDG